VASRSKQAYFYALALVTILYSVLRGLRSPNLWSATQFLFNYDFGFSKRGLVGTLLARMDLPVLYSYEFFFWSSFALFGANLVLLVCLCAQAVRRHHWPLGCAVVVYFSGMGVVFLAHTVGYVDHLGLFVALVALGIRAFWPRLAFVALFFSLALLIHEGGFLIFGPFLALALWLQIPTGGPGIKRRSLLALVVVISAEALLVGSATLSQPAAEDMYTSLQGHADYPLRRDAFDVLTRSLFTNMAITASKWHEPFFVSATATSVPVVLPSIAFMLWLTHSALRAERRRGPALVIFAYVASLSPLVMHLFGWDGVRWNTLAVTTSFLVLLAVVTATSSPASGDVPTSPISRSPWLFPACAFLVLFNLGTSVTLFDGFDVQSFPFGNHVSYLRDLWSGHASFPVLPEH
jgi:hypothetical protein